MQMWKHAPVQRSFFCDTQPGDLIDASYRHVADPDVQAKPAEQLTDIELERLAQFWNQNYAIDESYEHCYDAKALKGLLKDSVVFWLDDLIATIVGFPTYWIFERQSRQVVQVEFLCSVQRGVAPRLIRSLGAYFDAQGIHAFVFLREQTPCNFTMLTSIPYYIGSIKCRTPSAPARPEDVYRAMRYEPVNYGRIFRSLDEFTTWATAPHRLLLRGKDWIAIVEHCFMKSRAGSNEKVYEVVWATGGPSLLDIGIPQATHLIWPCGALQSQGRLCGTGRVYCYNVQFSRLKNLTRWLA